MTEEEAKEKWCPMARCADPENSAINKVYFEDINNRCLATGCMMWRWEITPEAQKLNNHQNPPGHIIADGYCGLGGGR
jgi:hypothetical protein